MRLIALLLAAIVLVAARPVPVESSIALGPGPELYLGGEVTFVTTVEKLHGYEYPMVLVACYSLTEVDEQGDPLKLYAQLDHPDAVFTLGGGSSLWWLRPQPAACEAWLMAYGAKVDGVWVVTTLAGPVTFDAGG
jgi:hypothetical protein